MAHIKPPITDGLPPAPPVIYDPTWAPVYLPKRPESDAKKDRLTSEDLEMVVHQGWTPEVFEKLTKMFKK